MGFLAAVVVGLFLVELPFDRSPVFPRFVALSSFPPFVGFPTNEFVFKESFFYGETILPIPLNLPLGSLGLFMHY